MPREVHLLECHTPGILEVGCDETGRGPLAGPLYAAAVILPEHFHHPKLNDSKKMNAATNNRAGSHKLGGRRDQSGRNRLFEYPVGFCGRDAKSGTAPERQAGDDSCRREQIQTHAGIQVHHRCAWRCHLCQHSRSVGAGQDIQRRQDAGTFP